jgi:subtilisin family serine protease
VRVYQFRHIRAWSGHCSLDSAPTFLGAGRTIPYLRRLFLLGVCMLVALPALAAARPAQHHSDSFVEVVVELRDPGVARTLGVRTRLDTSAGRRRLAGIEAQQDLLKRRILEAVPDAKVTWRYRVVLNGLAVVVPQRAVPRLVRIPGVRELYRSVQFRPSLDRSVPAIHAPALWGPTLTTAGQGMKIAIIDDGIDQRHPFFDPTGYTMPPGYPKGQTAYTTSKVIVARSFPAPSPRARYSELPFDPENSEHGTHVAGIAAGNAGTQATVGGGKVTLSGVAPKAYLGNYRVMTVPTMGVGLDGNSPEIAAGVEAAVQDGMDVVNLSLGEPEITPRSDLVARALNGAAAAGVVSVVAAGNEFEAYGGGSVTSPASADGAIAVAASSVTGRIASFSSAGPTPVTLRLKPDVTAPGVGIFSSVPARVGTWDSFSGTSMATPHVAGGAALLGQRHPTWTVAQTRSALASTARPAQDIGSGEASVAREGAGFIDLAEADQPLIFTAPTAVSLGFLRTGRTVRRAVRVTDAGGGAGDWSVSIRPQVSSPGVTLSSQPTLSVPGTLTLTASARRSATQRDVGGFVVLSRAGKTRRLPFWFRVTTPRLSRQPARVLRRPGIYRGNTRGRKALVPRYRYPDDPTGVGLPRVLAGPEQVFRVRLRRPVANFGVALLTPSHVQPRIVLGGDENHQAGPTALPLNVNPYLPTLGDPVPVSGIVSPPPGVYAVVFDSPTRGGAGRFRFRFWVNDATPPRVRLLTSSVRAGGVLLASASDRGAGVDPRAVFVKIDSGPLLEASYRSGRIRMPIGSLTRGRHQLTLQVSDYQECKNMENVPRILPNTTIVSATFTVR